MIEISGTLFLWFKALHIVSVIAWMAAMLYLPRLFVYHAEAAPGSDMSETFKVMERRLMRGIMNPSMILAVVFGGLMLLSLDAGIWREGWLHSKLLLVLILLALHGMTARWRKDFEADRNQRSAKFYRIANEVPAVLMLGIVILVVLKPF